MTSAKLFRQVNRSHNHSFLLLRVEEPGNKARDKAILSLAHQVILSVAIIRVLATCVVGRSSPPPPPPPPLKKLRQSKKNCKLDVILPLRLQILKKVTPPPDKALYSFPTKLKIPNRSLASSWLLSGILSLVGKLDGNRMTLN